MNGRRRDSGSPFLSVVFLSVVNSSLLFNSNEPRRYSLIMPIFSYVITDLAERKSKPIKVPLQNHEEAVMYGNLLAREMLGDTPELPDNGMCITILNDQGETVSILPFGSVN